MQNSSPLMGPSSGMASTMSHARLVKFSENFPQRRAAPDTTAGIPPPSASSAPHPRLVFRRRQQIQSRRWLHQLRRQRREWRALGWDHLRRRSARAEEHGQSTIWTCAWSKSAAAWRGATSNMREIRRRMTAERMPRQRWRRGPRVWGCGKTCHRFRRGSGGIKGEVLSRRWIRLD